MNMLKYVSHIVGSLLVFPTLAQKRVDLHNAVVVPMILHGETQAYRDWDPRQEFVDPIVRNNKGVLVEHEELENKGLHQKTNPNALPIGLDPGQVVEVRELIREIGKERTVLLSTHLLNEAQNICDRVLIINKGKIVAEDTTENLQARLIGAERAVLRVRGESDDDLIKTIRAIKGVQAVETKDDGMVEFEFASGKDVRPEVAKQVIKSGYDLLELRPIGMSLEEIFL